MTFRANEAEKKSNTWAFEYLIGRYIDPDQREKSTEVLHQLIDRYGPCVENYPTWHPLVSVGNKEKCPLWTVPESNTHYKGLDHTVYLRHAFITCPYDRSSVDNLLKAVDNLADKTPDVEITADVLDCQLYNSMAIPVLVRCNWLEPLNTDKTIPTRLAVPLMMEFEGSNWREATAAESWKTMQSYILGRPYGSRSSLFVDQECGQYLKKAYLMMINSGMYGPIYPSR